MVDGINAFDKNYIYQLMSNVQLNGSIFVDSQMQMHTSNQKNHAGLSKEFHQHLKNIIAKMVSLIRENTRKYPVK